MNVEPCVLLLLRSLPRFADMTLSVLEGITSAMKW